MKYSLAVLLLVGAISSTDAIRLHMDVPKHTQKDIQLAQQKAREAAIAVESSNKKIQLLKAQMKEMPPSDHHLLQQEMDVKSGKGLIVSVEAIKKPNGANKAQELAAMEEALKKATEEAHKQRVALEAQQNPKFDSQGLVQSGVESKAMQELKEQQAKQQKALLDQLADEEKQRQLEIAQNEMLEKKIAGAESERQKEEVMSTQRAEELKILQEEEAQQKLEAEKMEQEFLSAQAVQETKAAAAKKAAAKANLARLKRKHELSRRKAEAQLQMLKVKQQMEAEQAMDLEKVRLQEEALAAQAAKNEAAQKQILMQQEASQKAIAEAEATKQKKAEAEKAAAAEAAAKVDAEKKKQEAVVEKKRIEEAAAKKAAEEKAKQEKIRLAQEQKEAAIKAKKTAEIQKTRDKYSQELDQFSVSLNKKHFDEALAQKAELKKFGEDISMQIRTVDTYKKSFTFPQIAHNDYAVEQFETLSVAEQNLNNDPTSETQFDNFIKTSNDVAANLKERYKDQWIDPKDDRTTSQD